MKKLFLTMSLLLSMIAAQAADFSGTLLGGEFFFNIVSEDDATCEFAPNPNGPYNITLTGAWLPSTINYNGKDYTIIGVGEGAFRDGYVTNGANNTTAQQREFWGFPTTLRYVRADAFNGFRSNYPALLRGSVTAFDPTAMRNNKIAAINPAGQGGTYGSTAEIDAYKVNTNTDQAQTIKSAYATSVGSIIYKQLDGGKLLVAYPGDHRHSYHKYYQSGVTLYPLAIHETLTTEVDATGFIEIGENAFYGNENVVRVDFDQALTTIGAHSFENSVLTSLTLPATVTTIGEDAFKGVTTLTSITSNALTPPTGAVFEDAVYAAIIENGNITVPEEALAAYQADANWGRFWNAAPPAGQRVTIVEAENGEVTADDMNPADGATVTLTVTPEAGYKLKTISVEAIVDPGHALAPRRTEGPTVGIPVLLTTVTEGETYTFEMPAAPYDVIVKSEFELAEYTISVVDGIQNGTVVADKETANYGETVTLTVTPAEGYELETLTYTPDGGEAVNIENNAFTMPAANVTINATFKAIDYTITVVDGIQNGTVEAPATANFGETVNLTVTPAEGYELETLTYTPEGGEAVPIENNAFTMPAANVTINATFKAIDYTITVVDGIQNGTVEAPATANFGETVNLTVTPAEGYELATLTYTAEGGEPVNIENNSFTMPAANVTINATFAAINYTITIAETENGTVEAPATANYGETVNLTVTPAEGYELETLTYTVEGAEPVAIENNQFTMPAANVTINATFKAIDYTITVAETENGTVEAPATANYGETVTLTVTPAEGYELETLTYTVEGNEPVNIENNAFEMPAANVTINATFVAIDYTITVAETENGTVEAPAGANFGDVVNLTVTPAEGYELETLTYTVEGNEPVAIENNSFTMPAANVTINATFALVDYTITVANDIEHGTITAPATANFGDVITLGVNPEEGYQLKSITVTPETLELEVLVNENNEFTMPADNVTITAEFELIPPVESTITIAETENGTVEVFIGETQIESGATVAEGTEVKVVLTADDGYKVESFTVETAETSDGGGSGAPRRASVPTTEGEAGTFTFNMPGEAVTLTATFVKDVVTAINDMRVTGNGNVRYIDINGRVSDKPFQGVNIVVNADGTVTKMVK